MVMQSLLRERVAHLAAWIATVRSGLDALAHLGPCRGSIGGTNIVATTNNDATVAIADHAFEVAAASMV